MVLKKVMCPGFFPGFEKGNVSRFFFKAEYYLPGGGPGTKGSAFADIYAVKGDKVIILQVGRQTKTTLIPVSRERANLIKIREIMGPRDPGKLRALFKAYNQSQ